MHGVGAPNGILSRFGQADKPDLAFAHQVGHRADNVLYGNRWIHTVLVEEIDVVRAEPPKRRFRHFLYMFGPAVGSQTFAVFKTKAELRGNDGLMAAAFECPSQQLFIEERAVRFRGVEEVDAEVEGAMYGGNRLLLISGAVGLAHSHTTQAGRGNDQSFGSQLSLHGALS